MPVFSLVCPACYIPLAWWGHTPRPLLNFDISKHLVNMLMLSQPLQVSSYCWYPGCTQRKKMFLKQHCRFNFTAVSCHIFGQQSRLVKKPRKEREEGRGEKRGEIVSYLAISKNQVGFTFRWGEYSSTVLKQKENHNYSFQPKLRKSYYKLYNIRKFLTVNGHCRGSSGKT